VSVPKIHHPVYPFDQQNLKKNPPFRVGG
jgi:hypothetical protein